MNEIIQGDALTVLKTLGPESVDCVVTSPPYYHLRDYGTAEWEGGDDNCDHNPQRPDGGVRSDRVLPLGRNGMYKIICGKCGAKRIDSQIGLEKTPEEYVCRMVEVFREIRRVLKKKGTCWLNLGDSYTAGGKKKNMMGIPWRVAFALQADGWFLRQDIIWHKPNPMPENVTDRCTKAHEYVFLLTKSPKYYYDHEAIKEPVSKNTHMRISQNLAAQVGSFRANGGNKTNGPMKAVIAGSSRKLADPGCKIASNRSYESALALKVEMRNKRSVWTITTKPFKGAHFAIFPEELIEPMIKAGCPKNGVVLDPFMGAGTVGVVAQKQSKQFLGIELNPSYIELAMARIKPYLEQKKLIGIEVEA